MPEQSTFLTRQVGSRTVEVIKTYDAEFAKEAFGEMDDDALAFLENALELKKTYQASDIPAPSDPEYAEFVLQEMMDNAREDHDSQSFFIVREKAAGAPAARYVSPDWPSAEAYANGLSDAGPDDLKSLPRGGPAPEPGPRR